MASIERNASMIPVVITDIDGTHNLFAGQNYTCLPAPPSSATMIFNFGVGMQNVMFQRMSMQGTVTAININNISVYKVYLNDVEMSSSLPFSFMPGDRFFVECSRTNPATAASIDLITDGITNSIIFNSTTYYKPRTTHFVENMTTTQNYVDGIGLKATGVSSTYLTNSILSNPLKGQFVALLRPVTPQANGNNFHFGLNDLSRSNTYVPRYFRQQYMFGIYGGNLRVFELGVSKLNIAVNFQDINFYKMESTYTSPGVYTVRYYYSTNGGSTWTLAYTSLATHNGNVNYHLDQMYTNGYYLEHQLAELTQN